MPYSIQYRKNEKILQFGWKVVYKSTFGRWINLFLMKMSSSNPEMLKGKMVWSVKYYLVCKIHACHETRLKIVPINFYYGGVLLVQVSSQYHLWLLRFQGWGYTVRAWHESLTCQHFILFTYWILHTWTLLNHLIYY